MARHYGIPKNNRLGNRLDGFCASGNSSTDSISRVENGKNEPENSVKFTKNTYLPIKKIIDFIVWSIFMTTMLVLYSIFA